jgi:phosphate transport system substrate-binding protein
MYGVDLLIRRYITMPSFTKIVIISFFLLCSSFVFAADTLVVKGSTTVLPIAQAAAQIYMKNHPGVNITVSGTGSGDGIKELIDKTTDIANSSRDLKKEEKDLAKEKGVHLISHLIAIDAIVPIVHPDNPVKGLTIEQLNLIYQGKITNWKSIDGPNKGIVVISRDTSSGTYDTWEEKILHKARVTPRAQTQESNGAVVQAVSKNKFAIGYIGIGYLKKTVRGIKVNGVEASTQTAKLGQYPIARPLFMFTDGQPAGITGEFIRFLLSTEGQKIVKTQGFVPLD